MKRNKPTFRTPNLPEGSPYDFAFTQQMNRIERPSPSQRPSSAARPNRNTGARAPVNHVRAAAASSGRTRRPSTSVNADPNRRPPKKKRMKTWKKVLIIALVAVLAVFVTTGVLAYIEEQRLLNKIQIIPDDTNPTMINEESSVVYISDVATETTKEPIPTFEGIHNILLIGVDSRTKSYSKDGSGNLSDVIMILTINENDNTLKLTSVQRDSYVYVPGHSEPMKINAAMSYGGPQLLRLVLEQHLRIDLEEYAYVNFSHMEKIIDAVGGVVVNVSKSERTNPEGGLNELIAEQNQVFGSPVDANKVYETGDIRLNGRQAVAYARIRHVGNGDYDRSKRQVEVLQALLDSFMDLSLIDKEDVLSQILEQVCTNISKQNIENYALTLLPRVTSAKISYFQVPIEGYSSEGMYYDFKSKGEWSIRPNWNGMIPQIQMFIFGETFPFDPVPVIPEAPVATPTPTPAEDPQAAG